ncbi:hypothetical protein SAMN05892883_3781 [Jatrophihabitans sp. GAS493]|uniref:hypothetical protein n=1 Tax=Jatrophihabitans sp. GAS493 TaxID=1907575 RepID=UPI000BBF7F35|nr:hypothetical protein [Jatrophihabitans sp. GAS493]SOD74595.1 hypothetical protein SAMN05892883_3781 [Jatrophihabitans sp. GAS493]
MIPSHPSRHVRGAAVALLAATLSVGLVTAPTADAKASATGDFAVTVNGVTYNPALGKDVKFKDLAVSGRIAVRGINVTFDIDPATLGVYSYSLTGAPTPDRMVSKPTVIFASKVPVLTGAQRSGARLSELEVKDDSLVATLSTSGGKMKVQAKDAPTGGIFQMEPEFGTPVTLVHVLGPTLFYFVNPFTGKVNYGDGLDPVTPAQSATGYHQMLLGKDSPQVATKTFQDGTTTSWSVTSGGRMGGVLGEDAIELSAGASNCTSKCQAQDRIRGSLPVPPLPIDPTPIGS